MATIFKSLAASDHTITPFPAYYDYRYLYTSGSTDSIDVQVLYGSQYDTASGPLRVANTEKELFDSVIQSFYSPAAYAGYGTQTTSYYPTGSVYVVTVTQDLYGDRIVPGTFSVVVNSTSSYDDGVGNLIVSSSGTGSIVGRIFYDKGIALLKPLSSFVLSVTKDGFKITSGSTIGINFTSSLLIYEHSIRVKIQPNEFLYPWSNPTAEDIPMSGSTSPNIDLMHTKTILPYITTVGLYNKDNEVLAVAKVSNPIQRTTDMPQTFVIKFDT